MSPVSKHYKNLIASSPIEVFYCGASGWDDVLFAVSGALEALPRGEIDWDLGTEIRMNSVEEQPRVFKEHMDVSQGKLAIGWRLGECMEEPDMAKLRVFNAVYGGSVTSKLFTNVREKRSLCYYASSGVDIQKGLLLVSSAVNFENFGAAREEILAQLEAMRRGEITPDELESARLSCASAPPLRGGRPLCPRELLALHERLRRGGQPRGAGRGLRARDGGGRRRDRPQLRVRRGILPLRKGGRRG